MRPTRSSHPRGASASWGFTALLRGKTTSSFGFVREGGAVTGVSSAWVAVEDRTRMRALIGCFSQLFHMFVARFARLAVSDWPHRSAADAKRVESVDDAAVRFLSLILVPIFAIACSSNDPCAPSDEVASTGAQLLFEDPGARMTTFWAHPWPSDVRRLPGRLLLDGFPNPTQSDTLDGYLDVVGKRTQAFSRNAAIYASFDRALDPSSLPESPRASVEAGASMFLIELQSGKRIPIDARFDPRSTVYLPENHLSVLPPFGVSLAPGTTYALIGTTAIKGQDGAPITAPRSLVRALNEACAKDGEPISRAFAPLRTWLASEPLAAAPKLDVAVATVFTTQDAITEIRQIADAVRRQPVPPVEMLHVFGEKHDEWELAGEIDLPAFQAGSPPYSNVADGGAIDFVDGVVARQGTQRSRISFVIPKSAMPAGGWPVVLFAHGTGGSYDNVFDVEIGTALAKLGIASASYDGIVHGPRNETGASVEISFFNLFNIVAGRDNVRQGGADNVFMTQLLRSGLELPGDLVGAADAVRFDADRVAYLGHSQGGLVGAPFVAMEPNIRAAVFSGTAGVLSITLEERKDPLDFEGLLRTLLSLPTEEVIADDHPILTLIQTFIEPADPIAYGPSFVSDPPGGQGRDILLIEGFLDFASPPRGHEALAAATNAPLVTPHHRQPNASALLGVLPEDAPVTGNRMTPSGPVTVGLIQYPAETHFPIYMDADANGRAMEFLRSALFDGRATIVPPK